MEDKNTRQRPQSAAQGHLERISGQGGGMALPAEALALRLADLKRQLALRQAMA